MKRCISLLCLIALTVLPSCGKSYRDDLTVSHVTEYVREELDHPIEYVQADADYLREYFVLPDFVREHDIYYAADGNNLNEFGVFRITEDENNDLMTMLKDYLARSLEENQAFYDSYIPQETPKLRDAEVHRFGNYVAYAILDLQGRQSFFSALERRLKK